MTSATSTRTYTDRSRMLAYQYCPRARWFGYEVGRDPAAGRAGGIVAAAASIPLATGIHTHAGLAALLQGRPIDQAVQLALDAYQAEFATRGLAVPQGTDAAYTFAEQSALVEGLLRAWHIRRLPAMLAEYDVLETERERQFPLAPGITWQSRADAELRHRSTGELYVLSCKTAKRYDDRAAAEAYHDVQGLSEAYTWEQELEEERQAIWESVESAAVILADRLNRQEMICLLEDHSAEFACFTALQAAYRGHPDRVAGVLMEFLIKGDRRQDGDTGPWRQESPLVRGWHRDQTDPISFEVTRQYAWTYYWTCTAPHVVEYADGRRKDCPGAARHGLGSRWTRFNVWEHTEAYRIAAGGNIYDGPPGVAGWVAALALGIVQPDAGDPFAGLFVTPAPYYRQDQDVIDWREQAARQEQHIAASTNLCNVNTARRELNERFPQHRRSCDWPTACQFQPLCYGPLWSVEAALRSGQFIPRTPHHAPELALVTIAPAPAPEAA